MKREVEKRIWNDQQNVGVKVEEKTKDASDKMKGLSQKDKEKISFREILEQQQQGQRQ